MKVQDLFRSMPFESALAELESIGIRYKILDNKILLNYQINASRHNPLTIECRGLILDKNSFNIICRPMSRFFNYGEIFAGTINWQDARALRKIDGTLCNLYWDDFTNRWQISTRNMIYGEGPIFKSLMLGESQETFSQAFFSIFTEEYAGIKGYTYCFEYVSPESRVVTKYQKPELYLLTIVNNSNGQEVIHEICEITAKAFKVSFPEYVKVRNVEEVQKLLLSLPSDQEGYVVVDNYFNRIKVKNPEYFLFANLKSQVQIKSALIHIILTGDRDEFVSYFPEYSEKFDEYKNRVESLISETQTIYNLHKNIESQKDFALAIHDCKLKAVMFMVRKNMYKSIREAIIANESILDTSIK